MSVLFHDLGFARPGGIGLRRLTTKIREVTDTIATTCFEIRIPNSFSHMQIYIATSDSYWSVEMSPDATVSDVLEKIKADRFSTVDSIEWIITYGTMLSRITTPPVSLKRGWDFEPQSSTIDSVTKHHDSRLVDYGIVEHEVLALTTTEVSRRHTGALLLRCMMPVPSYKTFRDLVNKSLNATPSRLNIACLYTDADHAVATLVREHYSELHLLSGSLFNMYVIENVVQSTTIADFVRYWHSILTEQMYVMWAYLGLLTYKPFNKMQCYEIAADLGVSATALPCLVLFKEIVPNGDFSISD